MARGPENFHSGEERRRYEQRLIEQARRAMDEEIAEERRTGVKKPREALPSPEAVRSVIAKVDAEIAADRERRAGDTGTERTITTGKRKSAGEAADDATADQARRDLDAGVANLSRDVAAEKARLAEETKRLQAGRDFLHERRAGTSSAPPLPGSEARQAWEAEQKKGHLEGLREYLDEIGARKDVLEAKGINVDAVDAEERTAALHGESEPISPAARERSDKILRIAKHAAKEAFEGEDPRDPEAKRGRQSDAMARGEQERERMERDRAESKESRIERRDAAAREASGGRPDELLANLPSYARPERDPRSHAENVSDAARTDVAPENIEREEQDPERGLVSEDSGTMWLRRKLTRPDEGVQNMYRKLRALVGYPKEDRALVADDPDARMREAIRKVWKEKTYTGRTMTAAAKGVGTINEKVRDKTGKVRQRVGTVKENLRKQREDWKSKASGEIRRKRLEDARLLGSRLETWKEVPKGTWEDLQNWWQGLPHWLSGFRGPKNVPIEEAREGEYKELIAWVDAGVSEAEFAERLAAAKQAAHELRSYGRRLMRAGQHGIIIDRARGILEENRRKKEAAGN